jgi:hypothetical protein
MIRNYCLIIFGLIFLLIVSCKKDDDRLNPGNSNNTIVYIDTCTVNISTVLLDSLPTSNASKLIVGSYHDTAVGVVSASSFFQLSLKGIDNNGDGREDILNYSGTPVFDSLVLILNNSYYYGDITRQHSFTVYEVNEIMNYYNNSLLYNSSSFTYDNLHPLGSKSFYLQNQASLEFLNPQIQITLTGGAGSPLWGLGKRIFDAAYNNDFRISSNSFFMDFFKGLAIVPDASDGSILGYDLNPIMRLYYHDDIDAFTVKSYDFVLNKSDIYFNRITNDRTLTKLNSLKHMYDEIPSAKSNNASYVLTGINLLTKVNIPYLNQIRALYPTSYISKATLIVYPQINSYDQYYYLPKNLALFNTDNTNFPGTTLSFTVNPETDLAIPQNSSYTFDVTSFVTSAIENNLVSQKGFFIGATTKSSNIRAERLTIEANSLLNKNIKLVIYLSAFNQ